MFDPWRGFVESELSQAWFDKLTEEGRKAHAARLRKIEKGEVEVDYPIVTAQNQMV